MKQKIAISLLNPPPAVDVQAVVDASVKPLQDKVDDLQNQLTQLQVQILATQGKPP